MLRKIKYLLAFSVTLCFFSFNPCFADETSNSNPIPIPNRMAPNTIIEYIEDGSFTIISGGYSILPINSNGLTHEEQEIANEHLAKGLENATGTITYVQNPAPVVGMIVYYDEDGFIKEIENPLNPLGAVLSQGSTSPVGTYIWGAHNNTLTVSQTSVNGTGRATVFTDQTGDHDNALKKGDVATRRDYDNPWYGTQLLIGMPHATTAACKLVIMTKNDNGSLPDAIIDIWKTGVEYWGYTYSSSLSINNATYSYNR